MRFAAIIISTAALSVAAGLELNLEDYWKTLSALHVTERCLGKDFISTRIGSVLTSLNHCNKVSLDEGRGPAAAKDSTNWGKIFKDYLPRFYRQNEFSQDNFTTAKNEMEVLISKFRCTMQRIGMTGSNNEVVLENALNLYKGPGISQTLLNDLTTGVNHCYKLIQCLPRGHFFSSPMPDDVLRTKTFLNCERYMRNWACLKTYVLPIAGAGLFDFAGAEGTLDALPDEGARAAAIALADNLVGGDNFGLYL